jgi:hypothetical protein
MKRLELWLPVLAAAAAALFYLCFHSTFYNFDGVACAVAVELSDLRHLAHGNHLLYGLLCWAWTGLWRGAGYAGPALLAMQALNSLLGGLGVGVFCRLLQRRLQAPPALAAAASAGLALSYGWWFWSLEAQVYMLAALFMLLAADELLAEIPRPGRLGLFHALAMLGHIGHGMLLFPICLALARGDRRGSRLLRYVAVLTAVLLLAYAAAALWCVQPADSRQWRLWLLGSAALTSDRAFSWHGAYSWASIKDWTLMTLRVFVDPDAAAPPWPALGWLLSAVACSAAAAAAFRKSRAARLCAVWLAGYAVLYISWEPSTLVYRVSDLAPLWILIAVLASGGNTRWPVWIIAAWALAAGAFNGAFAIRPQTDPARNLDYQDALRMAAATPEDAWVAVWARGQVYVPYFAHRKPLNLRYHADAASALTAIDRIAGAGGEVFISEQTLRESGWESPIRGYGLAETARWPAGAAYRIARKGKPKGISQKNPNTAPAAKNGPKGTGSDMRRLPRATNPKP